MRIEIVAPEKYRVIRHENHAKYTHEGIVVVIQDALDAARLQLADYICIHRSDVKTSTFIA